MHKKMLQSLQSVLLSSQYTATASSSSRKLFLGRLYYHAASTNPKVDGSESLSTLIIYNSQRLYSDSHHKNHNCMNQIALGPSRRSIRSLGSAAQQCQKHYMQPRKVISLVDRNGLSSNNDTRIIHLLSPIQFESTERRYSTSPPIYAKRNENQATYYQPQQNAESTKQNVDNVDPLQTSFKTTHESPTIASENDNISSSMKKQKQSEPSIHNISYIPSALQPYARLARLDKPIGTMLLLHPCLWSTTLAYTPLLSAAAAAASSTSTAASATAAVATTTAAATAATATATTTTPLLISFTILCTKFALGSFLMRGAGCTINDMWDSQYDKQVERTTSRPLASGELNYTQAWMFLGGQMLAGLGVLLSIPVQTEYLHDCFVWGVASLPLVGMYPLMKRYTNYPQLVLGMTFNWGAIMGWVAVHGGGIHDMNWSVIGPLYGSGVCWTMIYDTLYAHQDKVDDAKLGLKSTALTFGDHTKPILTALAGVTWGCWVLAGYNTGFGSVLDAPLYYGGVSAAAAHLLWQVYTADLNNVENLAQRFRSNNTVGWMVFASCLGGNLMIMTPT